MDVNINDMWMEENVKVIQWKNTKENKHSETSLTLCLCAWFLTEMKKNEYNAVKCDKSDNKILVYTWDQV